MCISRLASKKTFNLALKVIRSNKLFILILLVALLIRLPPSLYLLGGQDQGTYISIAQQYIHEKSHYVTDEYRETLTKEEQNIYDFKGNYIMPSFEKWNRSNSEYSMVFYPMHPLLLGIFGLIVGMNNMVYLLTIFSILSLIFISLISYEITKSKKVALITLLLLALNPVHLFVSKFPVNEITALMFISMGYYFLIKSLNFNGLLRTKSILLILSLMSFTALSLTRMTYFTHIPLIFIISLFNKKDLREKIPLAIYAVLNLGILVVSYLFYRKYFYPLFIKVYPKTLGKLLKVFVPLEISETNKIIILFSLFVVMILVSLNGKFIEKILNKAKYLYLVISIAITQYIVRLSIADWKIISEPKNDILRRWNILDRGIDSIKHLPAFSIINYISVFSLLIFIIFFFSKFLKKVDRKHYLLGLVPLYFTYIYLFGSTVMRYDYYNSRYFLPEVIPSFLLLVGVFLGNMLSGRKLGRRFAKISLFLIITYFSFFSFFQVGKIEGTNNSFYAEIEREVSGGDLIVFINKDIYNNKYSSNFNSYVAGPLKYYFNHNVLTLESFEEIKAPVVKGILDKHENVFYLSNVSINVTSEFENDVEKNIILEYAYFNNPPGCNYHNYEFLDNKRIVEWPLPEYLQCKLLPNAYFIKSRNYYFGKLRGA
ncbi:hypothetical protein ACFLZK_00640 [Patescibacteria group bacterium]